MKYSRIKNIVSILVAILIIGGGFIIAEYRNKGSKVVYNSPEVVANIDDGAQNLDTDGDSLKDWEEILIGTDPKKSDTDDDGTTDDREIELKRDPLVKGPKDAVNTAKTTDLTGVSKDLSQIDIVSREFFEKFLELRQLGVADDPLNQQELVNQTLENIAVTRPKVYTSVNIITKTDSSRDAIRIYGNVVGDIFKKNTIQSRNEGVIAKEALEKQDPKILAEMDPIIASYKKVLNELLKVEVPRSMTTIHVDLVNAMSITVFTVESLRKSSTDPLTAIQGASLYLDAVNSLRNAMNAIKSYITFLGIKYTATEGGSLFVPEK